MLSIDLIRENLEKSRARVLGRVEDMRDHCLVRPTPNGGAHTLWTLGHLAYIEMLVTRTLMLGEVNPLAGWEAIFDGSAVSGDSDAFPPFEEVLVMCREARESTLALLDSLSEEDLDRSGARVPTGYEET
ncbi:MAG: DinB family protein, partial [Candidatus Eisenbacteria bacterium]|nr:DinB family protein [Candidatus Eisenbacteria bacterium]